MKILLMTGSHPRHYYLAKRLFAANLLDAVLFEKRGAFIPNVPENLAKIDYDNFIRHFAEREKTEEQFFPLDDLSWQGELPLFQAGFKQMNQELVIQWIEGQMPDFVITYGVHKIEDWLLQRMPANRWNIHGGLSPWYRGSITLFWPFYFLRPNWAGMTIHQLTAQLDGGDIIHHSLPQLHYGDGIHDVACRAVIQVADDLIKILQRMKRGESVVYYPQRSSGKLFLTKDWTPQHLRLIYNTFNNDIVDHFLDGKLGIEHPKVIDAFNNLSRSSGHTASR